MKSGPWKGQGRLTVGEGSLLADTPPQKRLVGPTNNTPLTGDALADQTLYDELYAAELLKHKAKVLAHEIGERRSRMLSNLRVLMMLTSGGIDEVEARRVTEMDAGEFQRFRDYVIHDRKLGDTSPGDHNVIEI